MAAISKSKAKVWKAGPQKHVVCEGARYHIPYWIGSGMKCSEPNCEINERVSHPTEKE